MDRIFEDCGLSGHNVRLRVMSDKIWVTGATGWVGGKVCEYLHQRGFEVVATGTGSKQDGPWSYYVQADIAQDSVINLSDHPAMQGVSRLIHCAGYAHRPHETEEEQRKFQEINNRGSARVLTVAECLGIKRVVYVSSIAFYRWKGDQAVHEDCEMKTTTAYACSKLEGERQFQEWGLDWCALRLATVFGAGDRANFAKLASALARKRFIIPGRGDARKSVIPVDLAAQVIAETALLPSIKYRIMNLALPDAPTLHRICMAFVKSCSFPTPVSVPSWLLRIMAYAGDCLSLIRPQFSLTSRNLSKLTTSTYVDTTRIQEVFNQLDWGTFEEWIEKSSGYYAS